MTIIVLDGQGGGIGRAIISALLPLLPQGAQLLCVGTNAMATAAMLKAGAQRGATGENAVRWAAQNADILIAPIALVRPVSCASFTRMRSPPARTAARQAAAMSAGA